MHKRANANLAAAKRAKNDEFYTRREDIEAELSHYEQHFRGKTVYCNCDDPASSEFWKFFVRVFRPWGLKKLIATHFEPDARNFAYKIEISDPGEAVIGMVPGKAPIQSNGDFRSAACVALLEEADIVVTNPPFSLFREYVAQLMGYGKKFLIIGSMNAITYKEFFPLLKDNKVWIGYTSPKKFLMPDGGIKSFGNIMWFTNLDIPKRHRPLDLRGNYFAPEKYPGYDNYDAVEVSRVSDIPCDYDGVMGVPITFMGQYCPEQFEIVGGSIFDDTPCRIERNYKELGFQFFKANGVDVSGSGALRDRASPKVKAKGRGDYSVSPDGEFLSACYARIFIRRQPSCEGTVS